MSYRWNYISSLVINGQSPPGYGGFGVVPATKIKPTKAKTYYETGLMDG